MSAKGAKDESSSDSAEEEGQEEDESEESEESGDSVGKGQADGDKKEEVDDGEVEDEASEEDEAMRKLREEAELEDALEDEEEEEEEYDEEGEEEEIGEEGESEQEEDDEDDEDQYGFGQEDDEDLFGEDDDEDEDESDEEDDDQEEQPGGEEEAHSDLEAQTISTVSNEIEAKSDLEYYDLDRQPAHVFPEPPWGGVTDQAKQVMISCLLPLLLALLLLYAGFKFLQVLAQCLVDVFNVGTAILWIIIRLVFSPLVLIWKLFVPTYLQRYVSSRYDQKIGRHIRRALALKRRAVAAIADLPNVIVACGYAGFDTCVTPARVNCGTVLYRYFGRHVERLALKPIADSNINRQTRRRRNHVYSNKGEHDIKMIKKKQDMIARKQKREAREKAKKLRVKRHMQDMNVKLQVADERNKVSGVSQTHQFQDKKSTEMISRTMIIERRYAVAIGFFWCIVGFSMLIKVLDGAEKERCTICNTNNEIEMQICRHGLGRDCAFEIHRVEISVAIVLMSMGVVLLVYSTFLYKPRGLSEEAAEKERKEKIAAAEKRVASGKRTEDADGLVIADVVDRMKKATIPRIAKKVYLKSPCRGIYVWSSRRSKRLLKFLLAFEERKKLTERSIAFQEKIMQRLQKFFVRRVGFMESSEEREAREEEEERRLTRVDLEEQQVEPSMSRDQKRKTLMHMKRTSALLHHDFSKKRSNSMKVAVAVCMPCAACGYGIWFLCQKTPIGDWCKDSFVPRVKRMFRRCRRCFRRKKGPFGGDMVDHRVSDGALGLGTRGGRDVAGVSTLEDVLRRFGFLTEEEQAELEAERTGQSSKIETERKKLVVEKPDPLGHVETQREAGLHEEFDDAEEMQVPRHTAEEEEQLQVAARSSGKQRKEDDSDSSADVRFRIAAKGTEEESSEAPTELTVIE